MFQPPQDEPISEKEEYVDLDARRMNILAARIVAGAVKSTLGPKGMDKMLVDETKEVALTDNGALILSLINVKHPAGKMMVEIAKTQENLVGDGTTTAVVLAGELLKKAEELMDQGIHPASITDGFEIARKKALEYLDELKFEIKESDLRNVATTVLQGKVVKKDVEYLSDIAVDAVKIAKEKDNVYINYRPGGSIRGTALIKGVIIDLGKRVHPSMPETVKDAKVLLIDRKFDIEKIENAKIEIRDPKKMREFADYKEKVLKIAVDMIAKSGANVVFCKKNIADVAMFYMAKAGILAVRSVEEDVLEMLSKYTGATIVSNANNVNPSVLGYAGFVEESRIGMEKLMYVTGSRDPKVVSILIRGGSENVALEIKRRMEDLIQVLSKVKREKDVVAGGGAVEMEISKRLKSHARKLKDKRQLAVAAFADAMEVIPKSIAYNGGLDTINILTTLRTEHEKGRDRIGLDLTDGKIKDTSKCGILEHLSVKKQALQSAAGVANMILRIDDVLIAKGSETKLPAAPRMQEPPMPQAPPGAMDFASKDGKIDLRHVRSILK